MDSSSKETIFDELSNFEKRKFQEVSPLLEDYLGLIARTGDTIFPWLKLKPLFRHKLDRVITEFNVTYPAKDLPKSANIEQFDFEDMHVKLLRAVDEFSGTPFTIQRLCELVISPYKQYKRADKFMRALEKDLLVVSTIDPISQRNSSEGDANSLVNGISGSNGVLSSPHHSSSSSDDGSLNNDESSKESECSNEETTQTSVTDAFVEQMESETSCVESVDPSSSSSPPQTSNCDQTEDEAQIGVVNTDKVSETVMAEASSSSPDLDQSLSEENSGVKNGNTVQEETTGECSSTDPGSDQLSDANGCDQLEAEPKEKVEPPAAEVDEAEPEISSEAKLVEVSDVAESLLPTSTSQDAITECQTVSTENSSEIIAPDEGPSDEMSSSSSSSEVEKMEQD